MPAGRSAFPLVLLAVALAALPLVASLPSHPKILGVLNDAAHAPVFGALAAVIFAQLRRNERLPQGARYIGAFLIAVTAGGIVELIQPSLGRDREWSDLGTDALGAAGGLSIVAILASQRRRQAALLLAATLAVVLWPIAEAALAYWHRARQFPTLLDFTSRQDWYFVHVSGMAIAIGELPTRWRHPGDPSSLRLRIAGNRWPGITQDEPRPDWHGYSRLMVDMTNADARPLALNLRVHDRLHDNRVEDRFSRKFELPPESRIVLAIPLAEIARAPVGRPLDLGQVAGLIIFASGQPDAAGREFYLTRIWLE